MVFVNNLNALPKAFGLVELFSMNNMWFMSRYLADQAISCQFLCSDIYAISGVKMCQKYQFDQSYYSFGWNNTVCMLRLFIQLLFKYVFRGILPYISHA